MRIRQALSLLFAVYITMADKIGPVAHISIFFVMGSCSIFSSRNKAMGVYTYIDFYR